MKKYLFSLLATLLTLSLYAQNDVTTFLGIPVDGLKLEMRQKLIAKGFTPKKVGTNEYLEGEFNGMDVHIYIVTNNNKVYRIMVCDANTQDEANIKIRYNKLVNQFENNKKYTALNQYTISDTEDISYKIRIKNETFDALFYQNPDMEKVDTLALQNKIREQLLEKYKPEQLENPTEEINQEAQKIAMRIGMDMIFKKPVWFRICEHYGKYYIAMYYDNEYNHANGEDL